MSKVRCVRILEYIGTEEWVKATLDKGYIQVGEPKDVGNGCTIQELQRNIQPYKEKPRAKS